MNIHWFESFKCHSSHTQSSGSYSTKCNFCLHPPNTLVSNYVLYFHCSDYGGETT